MEMTDLIDALFDPSKLWQQITPNTGDRVAASERAVEREIVINEVLDIIDRVSHKASARGQFWTVEKTIKVLRHAVLALKGDDKSE